MIQKIALSFLSVLSTLIAVGQPDIKGFKKTESGIWYKIHTKNKGEKAAVNDYVTMHLVNRSAVDSVIFSTYESSHDPIEFKLAAPAYNGDIMEGLTLMAAGDSATFYVLADSIYRNSNFPSFAKPGDWLKYNIKIDKVLSEKEYLAEKEKKSAKLRVIEDKQLQEFFSQNKIENVQQTEDGLYYVIHNKGEGPLPDIGQSVSVHYVGRLIDGKEFDNSYKRNMPFTFKVGQGQVIEGWDKGFQLLGKGDSATLFIPSRMAYGEREAGPIPPNSILIFDVKLMDIIDEKSRMQEELKQIKEYLQKNNLQAQKLPSGIYYTLEKEGSGPKPAAGQTAVVHYRGRLLNGNEFDSSYKRNKPFEVVLGKGRVIQGWEKSLPVLSKGSKGIFYIPSALAYGERGAPPTIPPNAILIFEIEMIDIK